MNGRYDRLAPSRRLEVVLGPGPDPGDRRSGRPRPSRSAGPRPAATRPSAWRWSCAAATSSRSCPRSELASERPVRPKPPRLPEQRERTAPGPRGGLGRLLGLLGGGEHVLLADPAADPGAGDRGQVDAVLLGQLAHQRGDVAGVGVRGHRAWPASGPGGRAVLFGLRIVLGRGRLLRLLGGGPGSAPGRPRLRPRSARRSPRRPVGRRLGLGGLGLRVLPAPAAASAGWPTGRRRRRARRRPRRSRPPGPGSPAPCRRSGRGSRCRPCRWRPRAAARRPRPRRRPA